MKRLVFAAILAGITGGAMAQGTGGGPAKDPTANGGNTVVNRGSGTGTEPAAR